jgi:hypothetical protein
MAHRLIRCLTFFAILLANHPQALLAADVPVQTLEEQITSLKKENFALKRENQQLRGLLAEAPSKPAGALTPAATIKASVPTADTTKPVDASSTHWLSNAGKRHNARCRYFQTSKGRGCGATDGIACTICGG